jgi:hypothetical protein
MLALALALSACTAAPITRSDACHEQADAWCAIASPRAPGCQVVYLHWCGVDGVVEPQDQDACLDAVATMQRTWDGSYPVPDACQKTWAP